MSSTSSVAHVFMYWCLITRTGTNYHNITVQNGSGIRLMSQTVYFFRGPTSSKRTAT